jgi:hypothetical protein
MESALLRSEGDIYFFTRASSCNNAIGEGALYVDGKWKVPTIFYFHNPYLETEDIL